MPVDARKIRPGDNGILTFGMTAGSNRSTYYGKLIAPIEAYLAQGKQHPGPAYHSVRF